MNAVGVPSPYLFAALVVGLTRALRPRAAAVLAAQVLPWPRRRSGRHARRLPAAPMRCTAGRDDGSPVTLVALATLGMSLPRGAVLARNTPLDRPTAALGMIAGGASGSSG